MSTQTEVRVASSCLNIYFLPQLALFILGTSTLAAFGSSDVRDTHKYCVRAVHVEYLAAGARVFKRGPGR
jgi:hypothetical protein